MARIDYSSWERLFLSISNLKLDKNNPRIPYYIPTKTTKEILSYLFEHEEIEKLAEKIVDKGFINHEPIYVTKENNSYIVIEGNRRISALKCLLDPSQAPSVKLTKKFDKLKNKLGDDLLDKVEVYVAPSRIDAQNILFELHAEGKLQWNRQQKNNFIVGAGATSGESIEEIAARFNVKPSEIQDSVQEYYLNRYFTELGLPSDIEEKALNTNFSLTNLSRLVNTNLFKQVTGFKINDGKLQTQISKNKFNYLISYFVKDIIDKRIDSRKLNKVEKIEEYINKIYDSIPNDIEDNGVVDFGPKNTQNMNDLPINNKEPKKKKSCEMLIPKKKTYHTGLQKLDILIGEAQGIIIDMHKNASALLLRTILELAVVRTFEINNSKQQCINQNGRTKNLSDNLNTLIRKDSWFNNRAYLTDLKKFIDSQSTNWNSLESLNRYAHGEFIIPDKEMLRAVWLITEPLILMCENDN